MNHVFQPVTHTIYHKVQPKIEVFWSQNNTSYLLTEVWSLLILLPELFDHLISLICFPWPLRIQPKSWQRSFTPYSSGNLWQSMALSPPSHEPGLASTCTSDGEPFYGLCAISICMTTGANPGQPFLLGNPSWDLGWPAWKCWDPAVIYRPSSCKGGLRHQHRLKFSCKYRLRSQPMQAESFPLWHHETHCWYAKLKSNKWQQPL